VSLKNKNILLILIMETVNQDIIKLSSGFSMNSILSNKYYVMVAVVSVVVVTFYLYRQKMFDRFLKKKDEPKTESTDSKNYINLDKDYYILDSDNSPVKLNLKEMIELHKHYMEQQQMQQQMQQQQMQQQQMQQMQQQMQQQQAQKPQKTQQKPQKTKPQKIEEESEENNSEDDLNLEEIENLKKELEDIKKKNQSLNQ
jgi:cell division protein FtsN